MDYPMSEDSTPEHVQRSVSSADVFNSPTSNLRKSAQDFYSDTEFEVGSHYKPRSSYRMDGEIPFGGSHLEMKVPDRIVVTGHNRHYGTKALPRELQLDTAVMMPLVDPEIVRIQTPPRSITLLNSPGVRDADETPVKLSKKVRNQEFLNNDFGGQDDDDDDDDETLIIENESDARFVSNNVHKRGHKSRHSKHPVGSPNDSSLMRYGAARGTNLNLSLPENQSELHHLREQLSRMNRRILTIERESADRKEKERYVAVGALFYIAYKILGWVFASKGRN